MFQTEYANRMFFWLFLVTVLTVPTIQPASGKNAAETATPRDTILSEDDIGKALLSAPERGSSPHLVLDKETVQLLKSYAKTDSDYSDDLNGLRSRVDAMLGKPLPKPEYRWVHNRRHEELLRTARKTSGHVMELALAWHIWDDPRYAERARRELLNAAEFPDWNPVHFLDTAEMSAALAIGLDWLGDYLSQADKKQIRRALIEKGLKPGLQLYQNPIGVGRNPWLDERDKAQTSFEMEVFADHVWPELSFNWNMVANTGMTLAALAVYDQEPELALSVLGNSLRSIRKGFAEYGEDGGFGEGADYWAYATRYAAIFLSAIDSAFNGDLGFDKHDGFSKAGDFILYMTGPTGLAFNFADSREKQSRAALSWLADRYSRPQYDWFDSINNDGSRFAIDLIWRAQTHGHEQSAVDIPTSKRFDTLHAASFRSAWDDKDAVFAAIKGGSNLGPHRHLDLGTFVLDADGERWAIDLGPGKYSLTGYFGDKRQTYYRVGTSGQNTLTFQGANQDGAATAPISEFRHSATGPSYAILDLGNAYGVPNTDIRRGLALLDGLVILQDEVQASRTEPLTWTMHTRADVEIDDQDPTRATLKQGGEQMVVSILTPEDASFVVQSAYQPPPQLPNTGVTRLEVELPASQRDTQRTFAVTFVPGSTSEPEAPTVVPLSSWESAFAAQ